MTAGQSVSGDLGAHAGDDGVSANAGFDALDGAKESASYSYHVGPFSGSGGVDALQGDGIGASAGVSFTSHDVGFDVGGDVADVLGFGGDLGFHVDPTELATEVDTGLDYVGDGLSKAAPWNW